MRRPRLFRTSSFRLTLLYVGLFSLAVLILFGTVYWSAADLMSRQIDETVRNELIEVQASAGGNGLAELRDVVTTFAARSPGFYYLLQDASGNVLAGNMPSIKPRVGTAQLNSPSLAGHGDSLRGIRGRGVTVAEDGYLFVGLRNFELRKMHQAIVRAFALTLAATLALALLAGAVMSLGLLQRVDTIARISRDIMAGDLARRIVTRGSDDEFDRLAASLNAMLDRIQSLMSGLQQVSSDIAHDLRTPLGSLRQRLALARSRETTVASLQAALDTAIDDVDTILDSFGAVLRITQIESGSRRAKFGRVDLSKLLAGLIETYQPVAEGKHQHLTAAIEADLAIEGDRELLTQMVANVIENAINHSPPASSIEIGGSRMAGGGQRIVIADTGPGIPAVYHEKVFQRFYRLEASRTSPGNGLGLTLVAAIAELHEASLSLEDNFPGLRIAFAFADRSAKAPSHSGRRKTAGPVQSIPQSPQTEPFPAR